MEGEEVENKKYQVEAEAKFANKLELQKTEYEIKMIELEQRFGSASEEQSAALSNQQHEHFQKIQSKL